MSKIITRFAPSPTNQNADIEQRGLHVGGIRTALYNYVLRKQSDDRDSAFIMRLEDTDLERSNEECLKCIIRDFEWTGIQFDAGFKIENNEVVQFNNTNYNFGSLRQSERSDIYNKYIDILLNKNLAYEKDGAIWFNMPKQDTSFYDVVLGRIKLPRNDCQDFVIRKSSGITSFYFAVTCDDHEMGVTDIVRGSEHINTAFRQIALIKALGFSEPNFCHIPLIFNPSGSKMSKRQTEGQVNVLDFRRDGYLPSVLLNYIALLGWSNGDNIEEFDFKFLIDNFRLMNVGKSNARFDYKKLAKFNSSAIAKMDLPTFTKQLGEFGKEFEQEKYDQINSEESIIKFDEFARLYFGRARTLKEPYDNCGYLLQEHLIEMIDVTEEFDILHKILEKLEELECWGPEPISSLLHKFAEDNNIKLAQVTHPLRLSLVGSRVSPPINSVLSALPKRIVLDRIKRYCELENLSASSI